MVFLCPKTGGEGMKKRIEELKKLYNTSVEAVRAAADSIEKAAEDADLEQLRAALNDAEAEADRCKENLENAERVVGIKERFKPVEVKEEAQKTRQMPEDPTFIGMDNKDLRQYSLVRAIRAAANNDWRGAELEREASETIAKRLERDPQGFFVPMDVQVERRDLTVGVAADGGNLVATDLLSTSFIEMLRNRMVVKKAGATILGGLVGDVKIPRQSGGATFYWVPESGAPTESKQAVDQVALSPKTGGAFTDISRKLLKQSSIDVENFVRSDLATVVALGIDLAALHGTGTNNQPTGIASTSGIGSVAGGTNGAAPTEDHIIDLETEVSIDNADIGNLSYITNAKVRGKLKKTDIGTDTGQRVWDRKSDTPLNGYSAHVTNQVRSNLDKGTAVGICSAIFFGNWADLIIGQWGVLDILVDPYTFSTSGTVRVVALQDVDVAVRHAESFAAMLDALTS